MNTRKLTECDVRAIRERLDKREKQLAIAHEFKVSTATISWIKNGRSGKKYPKDFPGKP